MELQFLGTSSGTPTKLRNVSAIALRSVNAKQWYLIDCGEATQHQLLYTNFSLLTLEAILVTHIHGDHCFGIPGLLGSASMGGREASLKIVAPESVKQFIEQTISITQMHLTFPLEFITIDESCEGVSLSQFDVTVTPLSHRVPSFAFTFSETGILPSIDVEKLKADKIPVGPLWGKIQRGEDVNISGETIRASIYLKEARRARKVVIAGDNDTPSILKEVAKDADLLVHEATYTEDVSEKMGAGPQHSSALGVASFAYEQKLPALALTHFSPRYLPYHEELPSMQDIEKEARQIYEGKLFLAKDFLKLGIARDGVVSILSTEEL